MWRVVLRAAILSAAALGIGAVPASAQEKGAITGVVTDTTGGILPGVTVTITHVGTGVSETFVTNREGVYEAPFTTPGTYRVSATLAGFNTAVLEDVLVNIGTRTAAHLKLTPVGVTTEVTVVARPPLVQTATASVGQVVDSKTLVELPSADRNVYDFMTLSSTVTAPAGGNAPAFRLDSGGSFSISGTRPSSITFKIDGLANTDPGFGTPTITPSLDAVHEFQVQNNAYSAQYEGIGQVNVATRSGTSLLRGSIFEFGRNEALQPTNPVTGTKPRYRFNQFGGTFGGPVWPTDRMFFFFSYEGRRFDTLGPLQALVPTAAERAGDFSANLGGCVVTGGSTVPLLGSNGLPTGDCVRVGQIFDPSTTIANPQFNPTQSVSALNPQFIRQPFPGNRIPAARIHANATRIFDAQLPLPTFGDGVNNYTGLGGNVNDNDQWSVRVDQTLSSADRLYGRLAIQNNLRTNQPVLPYLSKNLQGKGRVFSSTWTRVLGQAAVNEFRVGYVRGIYGDSIDEIDPTQFGIYNTTLQTLPRLFLSAAPATNYGGFSASVIAERQDTYQLANHFSWVRGRHAVKSGVELSFNQFNNTEFFGSNGTATFSGLYTIGNNALTASQTNSLADLMLGVAQSNSLNRAAVADVENLPWAVYVQDEWKLNDRMTLSAGLRYEYHQPWKSTVMGGAGLDLSGGGRLFVVDPEVARLSNSPLVVCCAPRRAVNTDKNDFAPRASVVFQPFPQDQTVVRIGYGLFYSDTTQFFAWRSYEPLRGRSFQGTSGDFVNPGATLDDLFPSRNFVEGAGVIPFFQSGVPQAIHGPPVISLGGPLGIDNKTPYAHQWSVSVQREILPRMLLDVTYQGSIGRNLPTQWIFNQSPPSPIPANFSSADPAANPFLRRPYSCCTSGSHMNTNILESEYNAVTVKVDKRFAAGYNFLSSYTWSRSIDQGSEVFQVGNTFNILADSTNLDLDRGRSTFDVPHRWVTSGSVELPFGQGKRWLDYPGVANALLGGWRLAGVFTLQSGFPFTPLIRNRRANTGYGLSTERGDLVGEPYFSDAEWKRRVEEWKAEGRTVRLFVINPQSISLDYAPGTIGNIPRNFFRAPFGRRLDFSFAKLTALPGRARLELRVDVINATSERLHRLDLAQFVLANTFLTDPRVGSIPPYRNMFNPRILQLGARVSF
jgi:carboxypeptidase family protein/TonB-dependent receptor-like protein